MNPEIYEVIKNDKSFNYRELYANLLIETMMISDIKHYEVYKGRVISFVSPKNVIDIVSELERKGLSEKYFVRYIESDKGE